VTVYGPGMSITDRDLAIEAVQAGARVVRSHYGSSLTRFAKSAGDFATMADIEAEKAITDVLRTARPNDRVLGEEGGHTGNGDSDRPDEKTHASLLNLVANQRPPSPPVPQPARGTPHRPT
jgi:3'-phosphoadenosine 5'-phosphosulfate (PAPS) 3'-phosphatase